jgi:hypothetical protein
VFHLKRSFVPTKADTMPPIPRVPDNIETREVYAEGTYRTSVIVAGVDVERQCLGHSTIVWFADGQPTPEASEEKRQVRTEIKSYNFSGIPRSYQYECKIVSGGTIKFAGKRE